MIRYFALIGVFTISSMAMAMNRTMGGGGETISLDDLGLTSEDLQRHKEHESSLSVQRLQDPIVAFALKVNPSIKSRDEINEQELLYAAIGRPHNDINMVRLLLKRGVNPNHENRLGQTPLTAAVENANLAAVEILIEHDANPELKSSVTNQSARDIARKLKNQTMLKALSQR